MWWSLTISRGRVDNSQTALIRFTRGLQLNLDKFVNQIEFLGHSAVTPKDIKRFTSFLFQSYCTATLHYGLRRERESMAKLVLRSCTKNSPIYFCCTFLVADVQYLPKKNNGWLQWCKKFDQNYKKCKDGGRAAIFCRVKI